MRKQSQNEMQFTPLNEFGTIVVAVVLEDKGVDGYQTFGTPSSNVIGGPRCGEFWPDPSEGSQRIMAYVHVSNEGVLELYTWDAEKRRWCHRVSTTKQKLIEEYQRRNPPDGGQSDGGNSG